MFSLFKNRTRFIGHILCLSGILFTLPVQAQIDVDKIVNDVMKEATRGMVETNTKSISPQSFRRIYGRATTKVNNTLELKLERGTLKGIASNDPIETEASGGSWRLMLTGWRVDGGEDVFIQQAPAIVMNYGNRFQYIFFSQDIPSRAYDRVNEKLAKLQKEIINEYKDVQVAIGRNENKMVVTALYGYHDDDGDIEDRLVFLMDSSREMIRDILKEAPKAEKEARKELEKTTLSYLNKDDFIFLVNDGYDKFTDKEDTKEGHWEFSNKATKASYETFNFGDRLVFSIYEQMPDVTSEEQRDEIVKQVDAMVAKKPAKGADSMEVLRYPGAMDYVWVKAHFALNGQITGKDVAEYYKDFKREYAEEFHNKILDVFKAYEKAAAAAAKDFENQTFAFVTQDQYIRLANDELDGYITPREGVAEGHFEFRVGEENRYCEILNHGDRIVYWLTVEMPSEDESTWASITQKVRNVVDKMPAEKAVEMEVVRYPGYDGWVLVKAAYILDGGLKGKDINKQYRYFVYDYSEKLYKKIADIIKDYQ